MNPQEKLTITIKTFFGLEEVLKSELEEMGYSDVVVLNRAVQVKGELSDVYKLNFHLRCAISVLVEVKQFKIRKEEDLYTECLKIKWDELFTVDKTFAVKGAVFSDVFRHSQYPFLLVKDAIVDTFRKHTDERPNVNVKKPQVLFDLYVNQNVCTISMNTSGAPLFQRGYREATGLAPLNEVVAAGLLRMSGWDKKSQLIDPFCGSGTILIEAALMACDLPPQLERHHFAFKNFKNYDAELWNAIRDAADTRVRELPCEIKGWDISDEMVLKSRRNLRGLPIGRFVKVMQGDFKDVQGSEEGGMVVTNPPYGERMGEEIIEMYEEIGTWMKHSMTGYTCWILSSNMEAFKSVGLKPSQKVKVYNGDLECSFRKYELYSGSKKNKE
ncbi:MAG: THUMP domain-containing class I SAM-dependent RNA methyltransferase [Crocinitomicaceae bacterium]